MGFEEGLEHGYAEFTWPDRSQYEGNRANGKQHSKGLLLMIKN